MTNNPASSNAAQARVARGIELVENGAELRPANKTDFSRAQLRLMRRSRRTGAHPVASASCKCSSSGCLGQLHRQVLSQVGTVKPVAYLSQLCSCCTA